MKKEIKGKRCVLDQDKSAIANLTSLLDDDDDAADADANANADADTDADADAAAAADDDDDNDDDDDDDDDDAFDNIKEEDAHAIKFEKK